MILQTFVEIVKMKIFFNLKKKYQISQQARELNDNVKQKENNIIRDEK